MEGFLRSRLNEELAFGKYVLYFFAGTIILTTAGNIYLFAFLLTDKYILLTKAMMLLANMYVIKYFCYSEIGIPQCSNDHIPLFPCREDLTPKKLGDKKTTRHLKTSHSI